jgi:hypothetical protein
MRRPLSSKGKATSSPKRLLLEELLVDFLDELRFLNAAADAILDHQSRRFVAVDENMRLLMSLAVRLAASEKVDDVTNGRFVALY